MSGEMISYIQIVEEMGISYIRRGEPDRAADWFYAYVDNAAQTHDWGETMTPNWIPEFTPPRKGIRTEGQMPHGFGGALYVSYYRDLFLHEEGHSPSNPLGSGWLRQGR